MKFKFIGKETLLNALTENEIYQILQFEHYKGYMCVYVIDDRKELTCIPYTSTGKFNENWKIMD